MALLQDNDYKEICNLTGLSITTVRRLYQGQYTLNVRYGTIQALAIAAGLEIVTNPYKISVRLIK